MFGHSFTLSHCAGVVTLLRTTLLTPHVLHIVQLAYLRKQSGDWLVITKAILYATRPCNR